MSIVLELTLDGVMALCLVGTRLPSLPTLQQQNLEVLDRSQSHCVLQRKEKGNDEASEWHAFDVLCHARLEVSMRNNGLMQWVLIYIKMTPKDGKYDTDKCGHLN